MAFVRKIWEIVNDPSTEAVVHWSDSGESFVIADTDLFMAEIVPRYFKLKKLDSFFRQLNAYGFSKVRGGAAWEFENGNFKRERPQLLGNMKRKNPPRPRNEALMMNQQIGEDDVMMDVAGIDAWLNDLPEWEDDPMNLPGF